MCKTDREGLSACGAAARRGAEVRSGYREGRRSGVLWPVYARLESLIERWGSRQLFLSRKLRGKIDVFAEELPRKSSPGQKFTTRKRGNRRITARNLQGTYDYVKDLVPELVPEQP